MKMRHGFWATSALVFTSLCRSAEIPQDGGKGFVAEEYASKTIYHSPQTPGYTCWVGAWVMPDKSLMVACSQATGPLKDRPRSKDLLKKMGLNADDPGRDFTGLDLANIYLRSTDSGATWEKTAEAPSPVRSIGRSGDNPISGWPTGRSFGRWTARNSRSCRTCPAGSSSSARATSGRPGAGPRSRPSPGGP